MKRFPGFALLWLVTLFVGCGKVGDPLPPFVRIPENVKDLAARQDAYNIVLAWTNPARYVDGSLATDLSTAEILRNGAVIATVPVMGAGQAQSHSVASRDQVGTPQAFGVRVATTRGRVSGLSNEASIQPLDVPGVLRNLRATVDQRRIRLEWDPPVENANLAQVYLAQRTDRPVGAFVMVPQYEDANFQPGGMYTYRVIAGRREPTFIPGTDGLSIEVTATDRTPPRSPSGLQITPSGSGVLLTWAPNDETDLAGYRIFRSARPDDGYAPLEESLHTTNGFYDPQYQPGLYYAVAAVDDTGNESSKTLIR